MKTIMIILFLTFAGILLSTLTSPHFWELIKKWYNNKKSRNIIDCPDCFGEGGDIINGENIFADCDTCNGTGKILKARKESNNESDRI